MPEQVLPKPEYLEKFNKKQHVLHMFPATILEVEPHRILDGDLEFIRDLIATYGAIYFRQRRPWVAMNDCRYILNMFSDNEIADLSCVVVGRRVIIFNKSVCNINRNSSGSYNIYDTIGHPPGQRGRLPCLSPERNGMRIGPNTIHGFNMVADIEEPGEYESEEDDDFREDDEDTDR